MCTAAPPAGAGLTYQDYLRYIGQYAGSEGGGPAAMGEEAWSGLSPEQQWANVGGGIILDPSDPRHVGDRNIHVTGGEPSEEFLGEHIADPGRVVRGDGYFAYSDDNRTPSSQAGDSFSDARRAGALLFPVAAGLGITAATEGLAALGAGGGEGFTLSATGNAGVGAGADGLASFSGLGPGVAAAGAAPGGPAAGDGFSLTAEGSAGVGAGADGVASGPSLADRAMNWLRSNPQLAARLGLSAAALAGGQGRTPQYEQGGPTGGSPVASTTGIREPTNPDITSAMSGAVRNNLISAMMRRGYKPTGGW